MERPGVRIREGYSATLGAHAGVAQWQSNGFPSRERGFDPRRPLGRPPPLVRCLSWKRWRESRLGACVVKKAVDQDDRASSGGRPSSVSVWVRDIELTAEQHQALQRRNSSYNGQSASARARSARAAGSPLQGAGASRVARRGRSSPACAGGRSRRARPARFGRRRPSPPSHARTPCACRQATMPPRR
jgi:hypothetical protein